MFRFCNWSGKSARYEILNFFYVDERITRQIESWSVLQLVDEKNPSDAYNQALSTLSSRVD